jgi:hypothetical protein
MFFDLPKTPDEEVSEYDTVEMIKALLQRKKAEMSKLHELIEHRRDRYFLDHYGEGEALDGDEQLHFSDEQRLVDTARNLLSLRPPRITASPVKEDSTTLIKSDKLESWLDGVLYEQRVRTRQDGMDIFALNVLRDMMGVLFTYWEPKLDARYVTGDLEADLDKLPIVIVPLDPLMVFPQDGALEGRWDWVMVAREMPILTVEQEWGVPITRGAAMKYPEKLKNTIEVVDVWSQETDPETGDTLIVNAVMVEDKLVKPVTVMDKYETLPFEICFCIPTGEADWVRRGLPITGAIEKMVKEKASLRNALVRIIKLMAQFPPVFTGDPGRDPPELDAAFGEVVHLETGETFEWPQAPAQSPDIWRTDSLIEAEIAAGGMGTPVSQIPGKSTSGYALALSGQAGTLKMVAPARSIGMAYTNVLQQVCSLAENYAPDQPMTVMGVYDGVKGPLTLTGGDCKGHIIAVDVVARFPEDESRDKAMGMSLASQPEPLFDRRTLLEKFFHVDNVHQVEQRLRVEQAQKNPQIQELMMALAMDEYQMMEMLEKARANLEMIRGGIAAAGQPPGQGSAPGPEGMALPVQGVPTQAIPQEQLGAAPSQAAGLGPWGAMTPEEEGDIIGGG